MLKGVDDLVEDLYAHLVGSCEDPIGYIDQLIESGELDRSFYLKNEVEILGKLDERMFTCEVCGWNYEISDISDRGDENVCNNCEDDY